MEEERTPAGLLTGLWWGLQDRDSSLGRLAAQPSSEGVPPEDSSSKKERSDDLLPLDPKAVETYLEGRGHSIIDGTLVMVNTLNSLAQTQGQGGWTEARRTKGLTKAQKMTVEHLVESLVYLEDSGLKCGEFKPTAEKLATVRFDYQGEPVMPMEDIQSDLVVAAWPAPGQAAVQDAVDFLPPDLKEKMLRPELSLKLSHEWPDEPHHSKVRASDEEWAKLVSAAYERKLMVAVKPEDVFKDHQGRPVLNGAGAVKKEKKVDGQVVRLQRFISNLIPTNMFQDRIDGDDKLLPYLGQLTLLEQGENDVWLVDSEDFTSCFNLFRIPPCWYPLISKWTQPFWEEPLVKWFTPQWECCRWAGWALLQSSRQ